MVREIILATKGSLGTEPGEYNQNQFKSFLCQYKIISANGCKTLGTFFLTHNYGNYENVEDLR